MKTYNIYFKDGTKMQFDNIFAFILAKDSLTSEIERLTTEEDWVDLQTECMKMIEQSRVKKE